MSKRWAQATYCDDIRAEVGGKNSFMGVYDAEMVFPAFPATTPKFCVLIRLNLPYEDGLPKDLRIVILNGDAVMAETHLDEQALNAHPKPEFEKDDEEGDLYIGMFFIFAFMPVTFSEPTKIRIRAYIDDEELKGNALRVRGATESEMNIPGFFPPGTAPTP